MGSPSGRSTFPGNGFFPKYRLPRDISSDISPVGMKKTWSKQRVALLRKRLRMTQEEFATRVGITWVTVSRWENGRSKPSKLATQRLEALEK